MPARLQPALGHGHIARLTIVQRTPVEVGSSPLQRLGNRFSRNANKMGSHRLVFAMLGNSSGARLPGEVRADEMIAAP